jgi:hypothetical protein
MTELQIFHSAGTVSYTQEMLVLIDDDENWLKFCLQITKWPVNTHLKLLVFYKAQSLPSHNNQEIVCWIDRAYEIAKLSNVDFEKKREKLILKATKLAQSKRKEILTADRKKNLKLN